MPMIISKKFVSITVQFLLLVSQSSSIYSMCQTLLGGPLWASCCSSAASSCDSHVTHISQSDIPYFIQQPGRYCLTQDITITSGDAITIVLASLVNKKVTLDLNGYTISGSQWNGDNGIVVAATRFTLAAPIGIEIINGTILEMKEHGIHIPIGIQELTIDCIVTNGCGNGGSTADQGGIVVGGTAGTLDATIRNCRTYGNLAASTGGGISLTNCLYYLINNCVANSNNLEGITIQNSSVFNTGVIENCITSGNGGNGISTVGDRNTTVVNCVSEGNGLSGYSLDGNQDVILNNIALNNTQDGFMISGSDCQIRENTAIGNNSSAAAGFFGFNVTGTNNRIYGNYANNNAAGANNYSASITNIATSPLITDAINFTANISE
jgi:parallel beta-helix repeat protein